MMSQIHAIEQAIAPLEAAAERVRQEITAAENDLRARRLDGAHGAALDPARARIHTLGTDLNAIAARLDSLRATLRQQQRAIENAVTPGATVDQPAVGGGSGVLPGGEPDLHDDKPDD